MTRKLASIQRVTNIKPIEGADKIDQATVMGWTVVVKKGEFKPPDPDKFVSYATDFCVFCEIDCLLPDGPEWSEFMRPRKFRVKTCRLRGVLSQGLALPITILKGTDYWASPDWEVGDDVSDYLGITKYELPEPKCQEAIGYFPNFLKKTDEIRLQSALGVLEELGRNPFVITVKLDGMSATYAKHNEDFYVCSRSLRLKEGHNPYWNMAKKYDLENKLPEGLAIQGELCGPKIQNNRLQLKEKDLFIFNVYDSKAGRYLDHMAAVEKCKEIGVKTVPVEETREVLRGKDFLTLENLLEIAKGKYEGTSKRREGIVVRPLFEMPSSTLGGSRLSFKVINNDFLLKDEK
jgi:RNA ligase (TIGR02306 family)